MDREAEMVSAVPEDNLKVLDVPWVVKMFLGSL